jgi:hypothetical protein
MIEYNDHSTSEFEQSSSHVSIYVSDIKSKYPGKIMLDLVLILLIEHLLLDCSDHIGLHN